MNRKPRFSRRSFLKASTAAVATAASMGLPRSIEAADVSDLKYGGLPIGIQSYSLRKFSVDQAIRHIQGLGIHYVEFYGAHYALDSTDELIRRMKQRLKNAKLTVSAHGVNSFTADHESNRKTFEFARRAGIRNMTANPQPDSFESLEKLVAEYDIRICIHNHGPGALYDSLDSVMQAVQGRHKLIGACIDTGHVLRSNEDPVHWTRELNDRVFALHIKDVAEKQKRTHDVVVGTAHLDLESLFKVLGATGFPKDGSLSLEYESSPDNPIDDIKQCLVAVDKAISKVS